MEFESKFKVGDRVWFIYKDEGVVCVFLDYIEKIFLNNINNIINYTLKEFCIYVSENDLVMYEDIELLIRKIEEFLDERIGL